MSLWIVADQEVNDTFHHERGVWFTWMDSTSKHNTFFLFIDVERHSVCNRQILTLVTSNSSAKRISRHIVELFRLNFTEVVCQIGVRIWNRICKVNLIFIKFESVRESECVVVTLEVYLMLLFIVILIVSNIISTTMPSSFRLDTTFCFGSLLLLLFRVDEHFHTVVVQTLWLDHVEHIEFNFESFFHIANSEVKPLCVTFRVYVILKNKVIFMIGYFVRKL